MEILAEIEAAVSRYLAPDHRADVIQNMCVAITERRLRRADIPAAASSFVNAEFRLHHDGYKFTSLDAPIFSDSATTLLERLTTEADSGYWDLNFMASSGRRK